MSVSLAGASFWFSWQYCREAFDQMIRRLAILLYLAVRLGSASAEDYLSNLGTRFVDPANPNAGASEIGDCHWLFSLYQPFAVQFFTGSGSDESKFIKMHTGIPPVGVTNLTLTHFKLDSATFEFLWGHAQAWSNVNVQLYHQVGKENVLIGELGNPVVNSAKTQWPESVNPAFCTTYVDYHPLSEILLEPSAAYWLSLTVASDHPGLSLLFGLSPKFVTSTDWRMGVTTTHDPWAAGEYLKFAVGATANIETNVPTLDVSDVRLLCNKVGANIVLSWPTSTSPCRLYSAPSFESAMWSSISTEPAIIDDRFVVTLPWSGSG